MKLPSYPKVYNLGHPALEGLLSDDVSVEEKVDGSQISFALIDDEVHIRSKNAEVFGDNPNDMFATAVEVIHSLRDNLTPGMIYRGEYLRKPKHNALTYQRVPTNHIVIFDIEDWHVPGSFVPPHQVAPEAERLGLESVPRVHYGPNPGLEAFEEWISGESFLGGPVEGIVIKNHKRFTRDGKAMMGKYVSEGFKETNKQNWKQQNPSKNDVLAALIAEYANENRWQKAVQHLQEAGALEGSPRDIGSLIKEAQNDIAEECEDEIKERLWQYARGHILRGAVKGLPEWYKRQLAERQFESAA